MENYVAFLIGLTLLKLCVALLYIANTAAKMVESKLLTVNEAYDYFIRWGFLVFMVFLFFQWEIYMLVVVFSCSKSFVIAAFAFSVLFIESNFKILTILGFSNTTVLIFRIILVCITFWYY